MKRVTVFILNCLSKLYETCNCFRFEQVARRTGKAQERMFFLFSDVFLYGKPRLVDSGRRTYSCCCVLPLKHCHVEPVFIASLPALDGSGGMFMVRHSASTRCIGQTTAQTGLLATNYYLC